MRTLVLTICIGGLSFAQDSSLPQIPEATPTPSASDNPYPNALTLKQKYFYTLGEMFTAPALIGFAIHAGFDQFRNDPAQWGQNPDSFAVRISSHFGRAFVRQDIAFAVRAIDHEDPRYFRLGNGTGWKRTKYAIKNTFIAHNDNGSMMPAYSRFISDYSTPFLVEVWRPEPFTASRGLRNGTVAFGLGSANNLWREFWPDVKKKLALRRHP